MHRLKRLASKLFGSAPVDPDKRHAPATLRNRGPILHVLKRVLPEEGLILEVASGTGEHAIYFGRNLPHLIWQPTDRDPEHLASVAAWVKDAALPQVRDVLVLDVRDEPWPVEKAAAIFCSNMIHIAPKEATTALLRGAARILPAGGPLILYGPFLEDGAHTSESNQRFDEKLRRQDPSWGVRDRGAVIEEAAGHGLFHDETVRMPANNLMLVFRKGPVTQR